MAGVLADSCGGGDKDSVCRGASAKCVMWIDQGEAVGWTRDGVRLLLFLDAWYACYFQMERSFSVY